MIFNFVFIIYIYLYLLILFILILYFSVLILDKLKNLIQFNKLHINIVRGY